MSACAGVLAFLILGASGPPSSPPAAPAATPSPSAGEPVIIFLVDNSASLPAIDPQEKRVAALEKMLGFVEGRPRRLILFGGRKEVVLDDPEAYRNDGDWTDFYFAFDKARELIESYPSGTQFRMILLTDALADPGPEDWKDMVVPPGEDLKAFSLRRAIELLKELKVPLYVVLVGEPPAEGAAAKNPERAPGLVLHMVKAANGRLADPMAQSLASFFQDDGLLLKKFVFRVGPQEGLARIEPVVKRIVAEPRPMVELRFLGYLVLPLSLTLFLLLGILVRSFPGPGDLEILELHTGVPVHVAVDRPHRLATGAWGSNGLSLAPDARQAAATFLFQTAQCDLKGAGLDTTAIDPITAALLPLELEQLRRTVDEYADSGGREQKIYALNLDYMAKNFDPREAEKILRTPVAERGRIAALDFLRAKAHLLVNDALCRSLTEPRVQMTSYGKDGGHAQLAPGNSVRVGRYRFVVKEVARGGRKDARLALYYDRVPSLLGLKSVLPDIFQRAFRLRRSSLRVVS
jgi:hypothetical protein